MPRPKKDSTGNTPAPSAPVIDQRFDMVAIMAITQSEFNPRKRFDQDALEELAADIRIHGVLEPIVLRPIPAESGEKRYWIIAGERRWRAARIAGLESIPAMVRYGIDDKLHIELAIVENLQRRDIDPIDEAHAFRSLIDLGRTQKEIGEMVGRKQAAISKALGLLKLPESVRDMISAGEISAAHGNHLAKWVGWPEGTLLAAAKAIVEHKIPVRDLDDEEGLPYDMETALSQQGLLKDVGYWYSQWLTEEDMKGDADFTHVCGAWYCFAPERLKKIVEEQQTKTRTTNGHAYPRSVVEESEADKEKRRLERAKVIDQNRKLRAEGARIAAAVEESFHSRESIDPRMLAMVAWRTLQNLMYGGNKIEAAAAIEERYGIPFSELTGFARMDRSLPSSLDMLSTMEPHRLIAMIAEALILQECEVIRKQATKSIYGAWYLSTPTPVVSAEKSPATELACELEEA